MGIAIVLSLHICHVVAVPDLDIAHAKQSCMYGFREEEHMHNKMNMHDHLQLQTFHSCVF